MKVTIRIDIQCEEDGVVGHASREVELPFAPSSEIQFECEPWSSARKPKLIQFDINSGSFYVYFGVVVCSTVQSVTMEVNRYRRHKEWVLHHLDRYPKDECIIEQ